MHDGISKWIEYLFVKVTVTADDRLRLDKDGSYVQ